jgi:hypothetical protein
MHPNHFDPKPPLTRSNIAVVVDPIADMADAVTATELFHS